MRIVYPKDIDEEMERIRPYIVFDRKKGWYLKPNVPKDIVERYNNLNKRMKELEENDFF